MAEREAAQKRRTEARQRRRDQTQGRKTDSSDGENDRAEEHRVDPSELKQAAKVAAAAAAVGAAVGAARAIGGHGDEEEAEAPTTEAHSQQEDQAERQPPDSAEKQDPEPSPEGRSDAEAALGDQTVQQDRSHARPDSTETPSRTKKDEPPPKGATPNEARRAVQQAREQLKLLQGEEAESVSSLERTREGWTLALEVVEVHRVPESTDVLATYEVTLDDDLNLVRYARSRRYYRAQADQGR